MKNECVGSLPLKELSERWRSLINGGQFLKDKITVKNTGKGK